MTEDTVFHKIIRREIPAEIVYEDMDLIAIRDIQPVAPIHILVIPKQTIAGVASTSSEDKAILGEMVFRAVELARQFGLHAGYRLVINQGEDGGQTVSQIHLHLIGGRQCDWPPG